MLREGTIEDAAAVAALTLRAWPDVIATPASVRHTLAERAERGRLRAFAWEEGGALVGWAVAGWAWHQERPERGFVSVAVDPARRGQGIGGSLLTAAHAHLASIGVRSARAGSLDEPGARALLTRHGYVEVGASSVSAVDPRTVVRRAVPPGVRVVPLAQVDDPVPVYELDQELTADIPGEEAETVTLETWLADWWQGPLIDRDASMVAFVGDELAALTMLRLDRASGRGQNNLAGTRRAFRRRGLATLVKSHSLARAAELGATLVTTANEERNGPMLAVNRLLGYRPLTRRLEWERETTGAVATTH